MQVKLIRFLLLITALVLFVGCTFYIKSYHEEELTKEVKKCDGITSHATNIKRKSVVARKEDDDVKNR